MLIQIVLGLDNRTSFRLQSCKIGRPICKADIIES